MAVQIKLYLDEHVHSAVRDGLRRRGIDVLTAQEANMRGAIDEEHLSLALSQGRVILTQDADFLRLHAAGTVHSGIIYAPQKTPVGTIIRGVMLIVEVLDAGEIEGQIEFI